MDLRDAIPSAEESAVETLPLVPLRANVIFPHQLAPLGAGRPRSVAALEAAVQGDGRVVLGVQRDAGVDDVSLAEMHPIAVIANVGALRRMPNGGAQALVEGQRRVRLVALETGGEAWRATVVNVDETAPEKDTELEALSGSVKSLYAEYIGAGAPVAPEVAISATRSSDPRRIADIASAAPDLDVEDRVDLLQQLDVVQRLRELVPLLAKQVEVAQMRSRIQEDVQRTINKSQREAILREQLRAVRKELEELGGGAVEDEDLATRVENAGMPEAVKARTLKEVSRLEQIPQASPELGMVRAYVDWLLELPWADPPAETVDIARAKAVLDEDHYGLDTVKDRILEWLAVRQRMQQRLAAQEAVADAEAAVPAVDAEVSEPEAAAPAVDAEASAPEAAAPEAEVPAADAPPREGAPASTESPSVPVPVAEEPRKPRALQTPILCFVGPPGVGKTSLGRSIARALGRKFVRLSLGGIRDEAEIRGHRRTYIGALPGRIIQSMKQAGTRNPVLMLDEVDKVGTDFRGDPSSALLEVLDPEQNREFSDHYLEVPYDLSQVLFITTANVGETISPPLRDRMEIIHISGYTEQEKLGIAERHLVPRQLEQHGLLPEELTFERQALVGLIRGWTREAGVRQLDRTIAQLCRKVPRRLAEAEARGESIASVVVHEGDIEDYLGPQKFDWGEAELEDQIGAVTGCVVSDVGGDIVTIEALAIEGRNDITLTGQLGSVMEESARAALSWARVYAERYGAKQGFFDTHGVHVHVPAAAIPKDGPSAGITLTTALVSVATQRRVRRDVAMTGEVTLRGRVLPIGGVKDKLLAAHRAGIRTFLLPRKNARDLKDVDKEILDTIEVIPVDTMDEVLAHALLASGEDGRHARQGVGFRVPERPLAQPVPITAGHVAPMPGPPPAAPPTA